MQTYTRTLATRAQAREFADTLAKQNAPMLTLEDRTVTWQSREAPLLQESNNNLKRGRND